jgi:predicted Zn-dependent peptidase
MKLIQKTINNIPVHYLLTNQFKEVVISIKFISDFDSDQINERVLIPDLLCTSCQKFSSQARLQTHLDTMYGARLGGSTFTMGKQSVISFDIAFVNERFLPRNPTLFAQAMELMQDIIFRPKSDAKGFISDDFSRAKRWLKDELDAIYHDKQAYAFEQMKGVMFPNELYRYNDQGNIETLGHVNRTSLYEAYQMMCKNDMLEIYIAGDFDPDVADQLLENTFHQAKMERNFYWIDDEDKPFDEPRIVHQVSDVAQSRIIVGYRTPVRVGDPLYESMLLLNNLLGESDQARLFTEIRERKQLSYDVSSAYSGNKGVMFVFAGVTSGMETRVVNAITRIVEQFETKCLTDHELSLAKESLKKRIIETSESLPQLLGRTFRNLHLFNRDISVEEMLDRIDQTTVEAVVSAKNLLRRDTTYVLRRAGDHQ